MVYTLLYVVDIDTPTYLAKLLSTSMGSGNAQCVFTPPQLSILDALGQKELVFGGFGYGTIPLLAFSD